MSETMSETINEDENTETINEPEKDIKVCSGGFLSVDYCPWHNPEKCPHDINSCIPSLSKED